MFNSNISGAKVCYEIKATPYSDVLSYSTIFLGQVKTKLGISENIDEVDSGAPVATEETLCHPLCQCNKCREKQQVSIVWKL